VISNTATLGAYRPIDDPPQQIVSAVRQDQGIQIDGRAMAAAHTIQRQAVAVEGDIREGADMLAGLAGPCERRENHELI